MEVDERVGVLVAEEEVLLDQVLSRAVLDHQSGQQTLTASHRILGLRPYNDHI